MNFVSISGVSDKKELDGIAKICNEEGVDFQIVIGYQVSSKSINQGTRNPRQPFFSELEDLIKRTKDYRFNTAIHYYTKDNQTINEDLNKMADLSKYSCLIQFNTLPLSIDELKSVKDKGFKIIFKVAVSDKSSPDGGYKVWKGETVQDVSSGDVNPLVDQVFQRRDVIDYAMFDPSHGTNLELDLSRSNLAFKFGTAITTNQHLNNLGIVFAGGIKPSNVRVFSKFLNSSFPGRISIDTESGVRTENSLNLDLVRDYLSNYQK
jgi:hypothetical protein